MSAPNAPPGQRAGQSKLPWFLLALWVFWIAWMAWLGRHEWGRPRTPPPKTQILPSE